MAISRRRFLGSGFGLAAAAGCSDLSISNSPFEREAASLSIELAFLAYSYSTRNTIGSIKANVRFPAASLDKLFIAAASMDYLGSSPRQMRKRLSVSRLDLQAGSDNLGRSLGKSYPFGDLLMLMIRQSDNLAANIILSHVGIPNVMRFIAKMGLSSTRLTGLYTDAPNAPARATTSAEDLGVLFNALLDGARYERGLLPQRVCETLIDIMIGQADRSMIPYALPSGMLVANKTGVLSNLVADSAIGDPYGNHPFIIIALALLTEGDLGRFRAERLNDGRLLIRKIAYHTFSSLNPDEFLSSSA